MLRTYEQNGKIKVIATIFTVTVIGGTVITADKIKSSNTASASTLIPVTSATTGNPTDTTTPSSTTLGSTTRTYKDGTYTASSSYNVPHGRESISVTVKLSGGIITAASVENSESDRDSASYQEDFSASYKSYVVGKSISGLSLGVVSGASDTTAGFDNALSQIASQAQA